MTRDDIIRLGHETDLFIYNGDDTSLTIWLIPTEEKLLKFANLVAAAEREAVGNIILGYAERDDLSNSDESLLKHLFELIRARGET